MNRSQQISIVLGLLVLVLLGSSLYTVSEIDQAIITRFGQPIGDPVTEPGLHMKVPFIDTANMFEKGTVKLTTSARGSARDCQARADVSRHT